MLKKLKDFLSGHADFKIYGATVPAIVAGLAVVPLVLFTDPDSKIGYENELLENLQILCLVAGCLSGINSKTDKKFFRFTAMALSVLILREISCGRTLFFAIPGKENAFYGWKEIKYGYLARSLYGIYIAGVLTYFFKNRLFTTLWKYIGKTKIPIWNAALMLAGLLSTVYAERIEKNQVFEESSEFVFYLSLTSLVYLYTKKRDNLLINDRKWI